MKQIAVVHRPGPLLPWLKPLRRRYSLKTFETVPDDFAELGDFHLCIVHLEPEKADELQSFMGHLALRGVPFIVFSETETLKSAALAVRKGALEYFTSSAGRQLVLATIDRLLADYEVARLPETEVAENLIVGRSPKMQEIFKLIGKVASSHVSVLLRGESGTGKELVAHQIHMNSRRRDKPFVVIDCAAIPRELLENELFGHEKGAYSGAEERSHGKFDLGESGTVFLDEIAELSLDLQSKILRVLQESEFYRIGGQKPVRVDVRILAATNRDLESMVKQGLFRDDLYHRLNVIQLALPPLRDRLQDMPWLVSYFVRRFSRELGTQPREFSVDGLDRFSKYDWPGNVRELENKIKRLLVTQRGPVITTTQVQDVMNEGFERQAFGTDLEAFFRDAFVPDEPNWKTKSVYSDAVSHVETALIRAVLNETRGNQVSAARILGISRNTLRIKMAELMIDSDQFKEGG